MKRKQVIAATAKEVRTAAATTQFQRIWRVLSTVKNLGDRRIASIES